MARHAGGGIMTPPTPSPRDHRPQRPAALQPEHDRWEGSMKPPRTLSVSAALHSRLWLLKIRRRARTLDEVVEQALDALEEQEANDG